MEDDQGLIDAFRIILEMAKRGCNGHQKEKAALKLFREFLDIKEEFQR